MKPFKVAFLLTIIYIGLEIPRVIYVGLLEGQFFKNNLLYFIALFLFRLLAITYIMIMYKKLLHSVYKSKFADKIINYYVVLKALKFIFIFYYGYKLGLYRIEFTTVENPILIDLPTHNISAWFKSFFSLLLAMIIYFIQIFVLIKVGIQVRKIFPSADRLKLIQAISFVLYGVISFLSCFEFLELYYEQFAGLLVMGVLAFSFYRYQIVQPIKI